MPNKDGTGPNGQGSKTGRGMGKCGNNTDTTPTSENKSSETIKEEKTLKTTFGKRDGSGMGAGRGAGKFGAGRRCCGK